MHKGHNFRYVRFFTSLGVGHACVSFEWEKTNDTIRYSAGVSFCSPKDAFDKERARRVAQFRRTGERVNSKGMNISSFVSASNKNRFVTNNEFDTVLRDIFVKAQEKELVPNWAQKSLSLNTFQFGLREEPNVGRNKLSQHVPSLAAAGVMQAAVLKTSTERI